MFAKLQKICKRFNMLLLFNSKTFQIHFHQFLGSVINNLIFTIFAAKKILHYQTIHCSYCEGTDLQKNGESLNATQRGTLYSFRKCLHTTKSVSVSEM